jgi:two-component system cell cycle response regulator
VTVARVLVIEDHPANLDLMSYLLRAQGHEALTATDGEQGLVRARNERPDLIVCDVQLPGMDGLAVAAALKADPALSAIPRVAVTALAMLGDRERVLAGGFDAYVSKPIDPARFVEQIEELMPPGSASTPQARFADSAPGVEPMPDQRELVLVVDDQDVNLRLLRSLLEPSGYGIVEATTHADAVASARTRCPDLVISDVHMLDGDGFDLLRALQADESLRSIPFMFLTSTFTNVEDQRRGLAMGARRYLLRPIEPQVLLAEIRACLSEVA